MMVIEMSSQASVPRLNFSFSQRLQNFISMSAVRNNKKSFLKEDLGTKKTPKEEYRNRERNAKEGNALTVATFHCFHFDNFNENFVTNCCSPAFGYYYPDLHFIFAEFENLRAPFDTVQPGFMGFGYVVSVPPVRSVPSLIYPFQLQWLRRKAQFLLSSWLLLSLSL